MPTQKKTSKKIYVYCPVQEIEMIDELLSQNKISAIINDYGVEPQSFNRTVICHYKSALLNDSECDFLISATKKGAKVQPLVSYLDEKLGFTEVNLLNSAYFFHQKSFSILSHRRKIFSKLALDYILVFLLAVVAIPIGLIAAIFIKLESPGPLFFKQRRTGLFNKEFYVIKFRSMRSDAEKDGPQWASKNDNRVTRVGQFIRKTRIDELPQLINVLKGDMSIIGPRPEREVFIEELEKEIPYYRFRHAVRPGITGLAQVKYAYGASVEDAIWKHKYDLHYIKHHNIFTDLKIVLLTVSTVLFGMGR